MGGGGGTVILKPMASEKKPRIDGGALPAGEDPEQEVLTALELLSAKQYALDKVKQPSTFSNIGSEISLCLWIPSLPNATWRLSAQGSTIHCIAVEPSY